MPVHITRAVTHDVRFPTSLSLDGSDAMNTDPDYSAAYVVLETDHAGGLAGHGLTFTIGRGTEVCVAAIQALSRHVVGASMDAITADMAGFWRRLVHDSQLRWLGPEKGVVHLAAAALVNAVWDLRAKLEGKPLWKLLADLTPEELVGCIDFRYIEDALTPAEALEILRRQRPGRVEREALVLREGFPAYTTSAGWLGYPEASLPDRVGAALAQGFTHLKIKVGSADPAADLRRARIVRQALGSQHRLMLDANQAWGVGDAIVAMGPLAEVDPWWIEEPTSPDDVLGHRRIREAIAPIRVATGEHVQNRIVFKQLFQAAAIDVCQVDACRLAGVNEVLAVLLLAAKFGVPVCPHGGGVGLCEYVQHLAIFDYVAVAGSLEDRVCEYVDHLHEHFVDPCRVARGRYLAPEHPGYSVEMRPESLAEFAFPGGPAWSGEPSGLIGSVRRQ
jgi:L-fuconate dehydratase